MKRKTNVEDGIRRNLDTGIVSIARIKNKLQNSTYGLKKDE